MQRKEPKGKGKREADPLVFKKKRQGK